MDYEARTLQQQIDTKKRSKKYFFKLESDSTSTNKIPPRWMSGTLVHCKNIKPKTLQLISTLHKRVQFLEILALRAQYLVILINLASYRGQCSRYINDIEYKA